MRPRSLVSGPVLGLLALFVGTATYASQVPIVNPSFEMPAQSNGGYTTAPPTGWTLANGASALAVWNPGISAYPNFYYNVAPPHGNQVLALGGNFSAGEIQQDLGVTLQPNTTYTLSYYVGARLDSPISSYNVQLLAGGVSVIADHVGNPPAGGWVYRSASFHTGPTASGELVIDLLGTGRYYSDGVAGQVNLDLIQLTAVADSAPMTLSCPTPIANLGAYSSVLSPTGGLAPYTFSVTGGSVSPLQLNLLNGVINGTLSATTTLLNFTATVTDSAFPAHVATATCPITVTNIATSTFLAPPDTTTYGTWKGIYGGDGYMIEGDATSLPSYVGGVTIGNTASTFTWLASTTYPYCLQKASPATDRICGTWVSSTNFNIDVTINGPAKEVTLYMLDFDGANRTEAVVLVDADTQTLLDTKVYTNFGLGQYLSYMISGHAQFQIRNYGGPSAVISGIFFGGAGAPGPPVITLNPANQSVLVGQTATFSVAATGSGLSYQWQSKASGAPSFTNIVGAGNPSYTTPVLTLANSGTLYQCIVSNASGSPTSTSASVTVTASLPSISQNPSNASVNVGQTASFTVVATGVAPLSYQWQSEASGAAVFTNIAGAISSSYTTPVLALADNGTQFRCVVTNPSGPINSGAAVLTVSLTPVQITQNPSNASVNVGQTASFTVGATGGGLNYQWQSQPSGAPAFTNIAGANNSSYTTPTLTLADNGTLFRCVVSNGLGPVNSNSASLTVSTVVIISATYTGADTTTQGSWKGVYGADGFQIASDVSNLPAYAPVVTNTGINYVWSPSNQDPTCLQKGANNAPDRIASVWYSSTSFIIDVNVTSGTRPVALYALDWDHAGRSEQIQVVNATNGTPLDTRIVSSFTTGAYLVWNVSGHVQFQITRLAGPNAIISGVFFGLYPLSIAQNPVNTNAFVGQTATFSVGATGAGLTYQWQSALPGSQTFANINGATGASYTTGTLALANSGTQYRAVVTNGAGSLTSTAATVTVTTLVSQASVSYVTTDTLTGGVYPPVYGADGYMIAAYANSIPSYAQIAMTGNYLWSGGTSGDVRAVQIAPNVGQIGAFYGAPQFSIDMNLTDANTHKISLYFVDWGSASRNQTVTIVDTLTGITLDTRSLTSFINSEYLVWNIKGHVTINITLNSGPNAVLSAIFFK